jgi:hypothetical protein
MAQEQTPKRWRGLAKIVKIIKKTDNYYFWVRVTDDPHGDSELLEGACFFNNYRCLNLRQTGKLKPNHANG